MTLNLKKFYKAYLIALAVSLVVGLIPFLLVFFNREGGIFGAAEGSTIAAIILLGIGGLAFVSYEGFFDIFVYGFKQLGSSMFSKKPNENNDFPGYKEAKRTKRTESPKLFLSILIAGALFLIIMIILRIVMFTM